MNLTPQEEVKFKQLSIGLLAYTEYYLVTMEESQDV